MGWPQGKDQPRLRQTGARRQCHSVKNGTRQLDVPPVASPHPCAVKRPQKPMLKPLTHEARREVDISANLAVHLRIEEPIIRHRRSSRYHNSQMHDERDRGSE